MLQFHLLLAWMWFAAGAISGASVGLRFWRGDWLGGYASWPRRLIRLGHIAFFGTGLLNIAFALTIGHVATIDSSLAAAGSVLLTVASIGMPLVCFLAAWRQPLRHLFVVPVLALSAAIACVILLLLL